MKRFLSVLLCAVLALMLLPAISQTASAASLTHFNIRLDEPIASYTPDFSPEFNTNATMYSNVTWQENSPGFSAKLNSSDEFKAGLAYKVEIWIRLGDGNSFATDSYGDLAAAITVNGKAISSLKIEERNAQNQIVEVTITCNYDPLPGRQISSVLVTGVPTPVAGDMPIYSFTVDSTAYSYYHTAPVVWWDMTTGQEMDSSDTFIKGHKYQVNIWLQANREGGFTFKTDQYGKPQVNATINSWAADTVTKAYEQDGREVIDIRYTFPECQAAHTCAPQLVPLQKQTCVLPGFKAYYECSCGKCYEDAAGKKLITDMDGYGIIPADGHKEGSWSYNGTHHYKKCTICKEVIPGTNAAHSGGTASCIKQAQCSTCGFAYGDTASDHKWSPTYLYKDSKGHAWICADCKGHSEVEAHKPGPAATETTPQTCADCGYVIQPAKGHTHELTLQPEVKPTCMASGTVAYYACSGCSDRFADAAGQQKIPESTSLSIGALGHTTSDNWSTDGSFHWRTCTVCKAVLDETKMVHELVSGTCTTCGYKQAAEPSAPETTAPTTEAEKPQPTQPTDGRPGQKQSGGPDWLKLGLLAAVCFAVAITVAVIVLKRRRKNGEA